MSSGSGAGRWGLSAALAVAAGVFAFFFLESGERADGIPLESAERLARIEAMAKSGPKSPDYASVFDPLDPDRAAESAPVLAPSDGLAEVSDDETRSYVEAVCGGCHSFNLVAQQRLTRPQWDAMLALMVKDHGMPELPAKDRQNVASYLASTYRPAGLGEAMGTDAAP